MLIDKDLRLSISGCFWLFYASKYNAELMLLNLQIYYWGILTNLVLLALNSLKLVNKNMLS